MFLFTAKCLEGDVRVGIDNFTNFYITINGREEYYFINGELARGRIEVCIGERYGTVCDSQWDNQDASVFCSQLGFSQFGQSPLTWIKFVLRVYTNISLQVQLLCLVVYLEMTLKMQFSLVSTALEMRLT